MATLPLGPDPPGPTAQALPSYLSYSIAGTSLFPYTATVTRIVYDPAGTEAPRETVIVSQGISTSLDISIVQVPQLYTGPSIPLGSLFTTPGEVLPTASASNSAQSSVAASNSNSNSNSRAFPSATASPSASASAAASSASSASASRASVSSASVASSASAASVASVASASSASASSASAFSASASSASSRSSASASGTSSSPTSSASGSALPRPPGSTSHGLSGGQIAGIVLGAFFFLLLLLIALLLCLRRRHRNGQRAAAAGAGGAARGRYGAVGGARPGSVGSDEWEEDHLSGGGRGGFFVVGGKRQGNERRRSLIGPRGRATGSAGNTASATNAAGIGAGLMAAALGARSPGRRGTAAQEDDTEEVLLDGEADADEGAGEMAERRGLMDFMAERPSGDDPSEMSQAGPGPSRFPWGAAALGAGAAGAGMYAATRDRDQGTGMTPSTSNNSNSGPASSHRHSSSAGQAPSSSGGRNSSSDPQSSNSTGVLTGPGSSGTSLPPPPRAPRTPGTSSSVFGNLPPSSSESVSPSLDVPEEYGAGRKPRIPSFHGGFGSGDLGELATALDTDRGVPRSSGETFDSDHHSGLAPALAGAAAAGGLSALAAGHRESGGSTYSRGFYPSGVSSNGNGSSSEQVAGPSNLAPPFTPSSRPSAPRHSHFISSGTPLLGPGAAATGADSGEERDDPNAPTHTYGNLQPGSSNLLYPTAGRLPTIRSVGEFGERSGSEGRTPVRSLQSASSFGGPSGSGSGSGSVSGSGRPNTVEEGLAAGTATAAGTNEAQPGFFTPPHTPRGTLGRPRSMHSLASGGSRGGLSGQSSVGRSAVARESSLLRSDADSDWVETDAEAEGVDPAAGQSEEVGHGGPEEASLNDHDAAGAAFGGELLGGMAAGWRRLTMGQYAFFPGGPSGQPQEESAPLEASEPTAQGARHDPAQASDPGLAAEVRSEHASVYGNSALGHSGGGTPRTHSHNASRHGSGENSSGPAEEGAAGLVPGRRYADRSVGSGSGHSSSRSQQGYTASVSNTSVSGSGSAAGGSGSCGDASSAISSGLSSLSQRTHLTSSGNASSSGRSRRGGSHSGSASGASSGGASYSPSHLVARSTISTRGGSLSSRGSRSWTRSAHADGSVVSDAEGSSSGGTDSEGNSSHATAGSTTGQRGGKRRRSASLDGLSRLDSVREGGPGSADEEGEGPFAFRYGHYPSPSLGAAAFRQAYRTMGSPQEVASSPELTSEHQTPRAHPVALQPSSEVPLPATMPASVSDPILNAATSDTWRPSPRVTSAAQRAAAAQAHLETQRAEAFSNAQQGLARHGVTGPPAAAADTPATPPSRSEYVWGDLAQLGSPNRLRSPERGAEQGEAGPQPEEQPQPTERGIWPGFLRF